MGGFTGEALQYEAIDDLDEAEFEDEDDEDEDLSEDRDEDDDESDDEVSFSISIVSAVHFLAKRAFN